MRQRTILLAVRRRLSFLGLRTFPPSRQQRMDEGQMYDVLIVGGGLAGLASAAQLARVGAHVLVAEQRRYPFHRVCGEYLSHEGGSLLAELGLHLESLDATPIDSLELTTASGRRYRCRLPLPGHGLSRYRLDAQLAAHAEAAGVELRQGLEVKRVQYVEDHFRVHLADGVVRARVVLGCHGKRSRLDRRLGRRSANRHSDRLAVKRHYRGSIPAGVVSLHAFPGGYCGVSCVEHHRVNVCYLTDVNQLRRAGNLTALEESLLTQNPHLAATLKRLTPMMDRLVVSQLDYRSRTAVEGHILMLGDAGGLTYPLCGNGMALALHSARLASQAVPRFLAGAYDRRALERHFSRSWSSAAIRQRHVARVLQPLFASTSLADTALGWAHRAPWLPNAVVRLAHGHAS